MRSTTGIVIIFVTTVRQEKIFGLANAWCVFALFWSSCKRKNLFLSHCSVVTMINCPLFFLVDQTRNHKTCIFCVFISFVFVVRRNAEKKKFFECTKHDKQEE